MKSLKVTISCVLLLEICIMQFGITVNAQDVEEKEIVVANELYSESNKVRNVKVDYMEIEILPDKLVSEISAIGVPKTDLGREMALQSRGTVTYTSTLSGAYNNYQQCIARSRASRPIDEMFLSLSAWYAQGTFVGQKSYRTPSGWDQSHASLTYNAASTYQFGSANSTHIYYDPLVETSSYYNIWQD